MDRLVYTPRLEILIRNERSQRVIDVSDDIINGNVTLRLNAMSTATFTLQNKFGKYLTQDTKNVTRSQERYVFDPMDRITIRMARVGTAFPIFSGYLDEVPYYQLYPGAVSFTASDSLKLLQYTFFDPGLVYLTSYFASFGWVYDPTSGTISAPTPGLVGNFDIGGGVGDIIKMTLGGDSKTNILGIANWPEQAINIVDLPKSFVKKIAQLMKTDLREQQSQTQSLEDYVDRIFGINQLNQSNSSSASTPSTSGGNLFAPPQGNLSAVDIAQLVKSKGLTADQAVIAVALAYAESSFNSTAILYNTDGSFDLGLWQINTVHAPSDGRGITEPSGYGTPPVDISLADFQSASSSFPSAVQTWVNSPISIFDPNRNADEMMNVSGRGTSWTPWTTYLGDRYNSFLGQAQTAVNQIYGQGPVPNPAPPITGKNVFGTTPTTVARQTGASGTSIATKVVKIAVAESQKNIHEVGNTNSGPLILKYQQVTGAIGQAWCASFVQWVFQQAGRSLDETHLSAAVGEIVNAGQSAAGWSITNTDPQPGDIVCWSDTHTGIVVQRQGKKFWTVEGNSGNAVSSNGPYTLGTVGADVNGDVPSFVRPSGVGTAIANAAVGVSATYDPTGTNPNTALTADEVRVIAAESTWMVQQTQSNDVNLSQTLTGSRALSNDISFLEWISQLIQSSGRVFRATPDGTFLAFYPDRFGYYYENTDGTTGRNPYFTIEDIEIIDLTVQHNDRDLITHVFTTGPYTDQNAGITATDYARSFVASVEEPAFSAFINVTPQDPFSGTFDSTKSFDTLNFLRKYGARPYKNDLDTVRNPILAWMSGWMKFSELWATTFSAEGTFTFLPELFPGGLVGFGNRFTMFVEEVTHSFDRTSGFTTTATLSSLSSNKFEGTVNTGLPTTQGARYTQGNAPGVLGSGN